MQAAAAMDTAGVSPPARRKGRHTGIDRRNLALLNPSLLKEIFDCLLARELASLSRGFYRVAQVRNNLAITRLVLRNIP